MGQAYHNCSLLQSAILASVFRKKRQILLEIINIVTHIQIKKTHFKKQITYLKKLLLPRGIPLLYFCKYNFQVSPQSSGESEINFIKSSFKSYLA